MKRADWSKPYSHMPIWTREISLLELDGGGELRVQRHTRARFSWSATTHLLPASGRIEVGEVSGYAGTLADAMDQAVLAVRFLGRRVSS